jgi:hypothetical protein
VDGPVAQGIMDEIDAQAQSLGDLVSALSEAYASGELEARDASGTATGLSLA